MSYTTPPPIDIEFTCENEEQFEKYKPRLLEIRDKIYGQPWDDQTKDILQYEMLRLEDYIEHYEEPWGRNIHANLTGPAAYNNKEWSLKDLLEYHKYYWPDRHEEKKTYKRIDVNNMLFELKLKGVINGYECIALPYSIAEHYNNELFPEWETISVLEKYNIKKRGV